MPADRLSKKEVKLRVHSLLRRLIGPVLALAVALPMAGCLETTGGIAEKISAVAGYSVTQAQVDGMRNSYNVAYLVPAANYRELAKCKPGTSFNILTNRCRDNDIVRQLVSADTAILNGFTKLQTAIDSGNRPGALSAYTALKTTVDTAIGIVQGYKLNQLQ